MKASETIEFAAGVDRCVVVVAPFRDMDHTCGEPVVGERGGWPMCQDHFDLFDPGRWP